MAGPARCVLSFLAISDLRTARRIWDNPEIDLFGFLNAVTGLCKELDQVDVFFVWNIYATVLSFSLSIARQESRFQGVIHKLRHTNFMIFLSFPVLVTDGHISETPPYLV